MNRQPIRRKIWQLEPRFHCSVVGTCLDLDELRKLGRKMQIPGKTLRDDYRLHSTFVGLVGESSGAAKLLNKFLDRKYITTIKRFNAAQDSRSLLALWNDARNRGDVSAAFWALITHPQATESLLIDVYGQVHMLSHLSGASVRVDMERFNHLKNEVPRLKRQVRQMAKELEDGQIKLRHARQQQDSLHQENARLRTTIEQLNATINRLEKKHDIRVLKEDNEKLQTKARKHQQQNQQLHIQIDKWKKRAITYRNERDELRADQQQLELQQQAMERSLEEWLSPDCASCDNHAQCDGRLDLCNRCILYVGGRNRQCAHFKALVEQHNGQFIHHDGGLEQSPHHLSSLLSRADAVFCPLDCISHGAFNRIRQDCKRHDKPLQLLTQSSLAAFARGLNEIASNP
ncbi:DUF2325 domain-containing protein [Thiolapillus brandeum]|nr:DUF2325 domain-containing protein [Thiolapillus brandeum]